MYMGIQYEYSEEDIDVMVKNLQFTDPKNANREYAKAKLEELKAGAHSMADADPERLLKLQKKLDKPDESQ